MDPITTGAAISAGTQLVQNAVNWGATRRNNDFQLKMWNLNNEYNTPKNQMKRFVEAGLNPHLIYGQGNAGNSSGAPSSQAPQVDFSALGDVVKTYLELKAMDKAIEGKEYDNVIRGNDAALSNFGMGFWDTTAYEKDAYLPPAVRQYLNNMEKTREDIETQNINQADKQFDLRLKEMLRFIPEGQRERWDKYEILPDDSESLQFLKIVGKDIFGFKDWDSFRNFFLNFVR